MSIAGRLKQKMRNGEQFSLKGDIHKGIFRLLDSSTMCVYLDDDPDERPGLLLMTDPHVPICVGDQLARGDRTYSVLRAMTHNIAGIPMVKIAILIKTR